jgi:hypothetical protein
MITIRTGTTAALLIALLAIAGCGGSAPVTSPTEAPENPYGGFPIDPPADDEVVLSIDGNPGLELTYAEMQARATVTYDIVEPFVARAESFTGVLLSDLAQEAGLPADAQVTTLALNGYEYADSLATLVDSDAMIAVFRDGEIIPMDEGGPIRLIFPAGSAYYEFLDAWNWSLRNIESGAPQP